LLEAFPVVQDAESVSACGLDLFGIERDAAEEGTVATEPAGLTERRQLGIHIGSG